MIGQLEGGSQRRIRVVFLNDSARIGGAEQSLAILVKNLDPQLFETTVICPAEGPLIEILRDSGIYVIPVNIYHFSRKRNPFKYLFSLYRLARILNKLDVDIIHCNSSTSAQWGIPLGKLMSVETFCHVRGVRDVHVRFTSFLFRHASREVKFIAISKFVQKTLDLIGVPRSQITVIYNGVDTEMFSPGIVGGAFEQEFHPDKTKLRVGIIGRIEEWKRHIDVVEAAGLLTSRVDLQIYIVGEFWRDNDPSHDRLRARLYKLGLEDKVVFTGFRRNVLEMMAGMDAIVVPSENEPFGRVTIEAMALGKPVIGTLSGGTPEIIQNGISGILVPVRSPEAIADAVEVIANNREFAESLGRNARKRVMESFSIQAHTGQIQKLYFQACPATGSHVDKLLISKRRATLN